MLRIKNETNGTETLVFGNHIILNYAKSKDVHTSIVMNADSLNYLLNHESKCLADHINEVLRIAYQYPNKCGAYEDWVGSLRATDYHPKVVESCARQFQALEHILNEAAKNDNIQTQDVWYIIRRLEFNYRHLLSKVEKYGYAKAIHSLDNTLTLQLTGDERGFASHHEPIGVDYFRRRVVLGGSDTGFEFADGAIRNIKNKKIASILKATERKGVIKGFVRKSSTYYERALRESLTVTYEDIIRYNQELDELASTQQ